MKLEEYCEKFVELYKRLQEEHGLLDNVTLQTCYDNKVRMSIEFIEK